MKRKILMFLHLLSLLINGTISFQRFVKYNYNTKQWIKVFLPIGNNLFKEEKLFFNTNLIPVDEWCYKIVGTQSRLVNKEIFWPMHKELYEYDVVDDTFTLIDVED